MEFNNSADQKYRATTRVGFRLTVDQTAIAVYEHLSSTVYPNPGETKLTKGLISEAVRKSLLYYGASVMDKNSEHRENHISTDWDGRYYDETMAWIETAILDLFSELHKFKVQA